MARYLKQTEQQIRAAINDLIDREALQTERVVYYPTSYVVEVMAGMGYTITQDYVRRRYAEIGVRNENGLWVRDTK